MMFKAVLLGVLALLLCTAVAQAQEMQRFWHGLGASTSGGVAIACDAGLSECVVCKTTPNVVCTKLNVAGDM